MNTIQARNITNGWGFPGNGGMPSSRKLMVVNPKKQMIKELLKLPKKEFLNELQTLGKRERAEILDSKQISRYMKKHNITLSDLLSNLPSGNDPQGEPTINPAGKRSLRRLLIALLPLALDGNQIGMTDNNTKSAAPISRKNNTLQSPIVISPPGTSTPSTTSAELPKCDDMLTITQAERAEIIKGYKKHLANAVEAELSKTPLWEGSAIENAYMRAKDTYAGASPLDVKTPFKQVCAPLDTAIQRIKKEYQNNPECAKGIIEKEVSDYVDTLAQNPAFEGNNAVRLRASSDPSYFTEDCKGDKRGQTIPRRATQAQADEDYAHNQKHVIAQQALDIIDSVAARFLKNFCFSKVSEPTESDCFSPTGG